MVEMAPSRKSMDEGDSFSWFWGHANKLLIIIIYKILQLNNVVNFSIYNTSKYPDVASGLAF